VKAIGPGVIIRQCHPPAHDRRFPRASNADQMVQHRQHDFHALVASVTGPEARVQTAYTVALTLCRRRLALGATLWRRLFVTRAAGRPSGPVTGSDGTPLTSHEQRPPPDSSVCGKGRLWRHDFTARGQAGHGPLDAELRWPVRGDADRRRAWAVEGATDEAYRASRTALAHILGLPLSLQALDPGVAEAGPEVANCSEQLAAPLALPAVGTSLVVQADGTGVPMVQPPTRTPPMRRGNGPKRTQKQEAVVPGLDTMAPSPRTPPEVVAALVQAPDGRAPGARPVPVGQELRATVEGQAVAMARRVKRAAPRDGPPIQARVALTAGAEALQQQLRARFPKHTVVLDIIHATASLWDAANALLGDTQRHRTAGVRSDRAALVAGPTEAGRTALAAEANDPPCTGTQRHAVRRPLGSDRRNRPSLPDDEDLAQGWPSGTGVSEGAGRPLVKDRLAQSGRRWTTTGAHAVLDLRAVRRNGPWEAYGPLHRHPQHRRLYGLSAQVPEEADAQALT
jgi:hypothetical protein